MRALFFTLLALFLVSGYSIAEEDQVQIGFFETSPWDVLQGGFYGTYRVAPPAGPNSPKKSVTWRVNIPKPGASYTVQATWIADPSNARSAKYSIFDGKKFLRAVTVNQKVAPKGDKSGSVTFQDLGTFLITSTNLQVDLSNDADGRVVADTIRVK